MCESCGGMEWMWTSRETRPVVDSPCSTRGLRTGGRLGRKVLKSLKSGRPVVVPSGSCASMLRVYYPQLFEGDRQYGEMAEEIASRTYEFGEYMVKVLGVTEVESSFTGNVTYHPSCHLLREVGAGGESEGLVRATCGDRYRPLPQGETCCGFGGTFAVKMSHISESMLADKVANVAATGADGLVSSDMGCLMHIGGGLSRRRSCGAAQCTSPNCWMWRVDMAEVKTQEFMPASAAALANEQIQKALRGVSGFDIGRRSASRN